MARRWVAQGAAYLHLVDLDGAKQGRPVNGDSIRAIVDAVDVPCQLGGGLRTESDIAEALGVTPKSVGRWFARARDGGTEGLRAHPSPDRRPSSTPRRSA